MDPAAKLQLIMELLHPPIYDKDGFVVGHKRKGLITKEEAIKLLGFNSDDQPSGT